MSELVADLLAEASQVTDLSARTLMLRAADELEKVEDEADKLAHEAARESARADAAEKAKPSVEVHDYLNMP